jgi:hypothetical protein
MTDYSFWGSTKNKWFFHLFFVFLFMGFLLFMVFCFLFVGFVFMGFVFSRHLITHQGHTGCRREIGVEEVS